MMLEDQQIAQKNLYNPNNFLENQLMNSNLRYYGLITEFSLWLEIQPHELILTVKIRYLKVLLLRVSRKIIWLVRNFLTYDWTFKNYQQKSSSAANFVGYFTMPICIWRLRQYYLSYYSSHDISKKSLGFKEFYELHVSLLSSLVVKLHHSKSNVFLTLEYLWQATPNCIKIFYQY